MYQQIVKALRLYKESKNLFISKNMFDNDLSFGKDWDGIVKELNLPEDTKCIELKVVSAESVDFIKKEE